MSFTAIGLPIHGLHAPGVHVPVLRAGSCRNPGNLVLIPVCHIDPKKAAENFVHSRDYSRHKDMPRAAVHN